MDWFSFLVGCFVTSCLSWVGSSAKEKLAMMEVEKLVAMREIRHEVRVRRQESESLPTVLGSPLPPILVRPIR